MNTPYIKQFNEMGELLNPINKRYQSKTYLGLDINEDPMFYPNRKERRLKVGTLNNRKIRKKRGSKSIISRIKNHIRNIRLSRCMTK